MCPPKSFSTITPEYQQTLRDMHARAPWGQHGFIYTSGWLPFFRKLGCKSVLDYGSGAESLRIGLAKQQPDIDVRCYDPGVIGREDPPVPADFVVCTDTFEHIEEPFVDDVFQHIKGLMLIGGYLRLTTSRAKRILPDGRNAHIFQRPRTWWLLKFKEHGYNIVKQDGGTKTVIVWIRK